MPNEINYAEVYQSFIDEELEARSYTQWMVPNGSEIEYSGGKTVKIAKLSVGGLGNYDAENATAKYPKGAVKLEWVPYEMEMDRAVRFELGRLDPSDSHFIATTENITRTFTRKQLVPEQDTFRFNRIYKKISNHKKYKDTHIKKLTAADTGDKLAAALSELHTIVKDDSGEDVDFICFMSVRNEPFFREISKNNQHSISFGKDVTVNGITYQGAMVFNGLPCVFVPSKRLQTVIAVNDGHTSGQESGGIAVGPSSEQIEFLLMNSDAPMACGKIDSLKVFSADENQTGDETTINYHLLYDLWVKDNQVATLAAGIRASAGGGS